MEHLNQRALSRSNKEEIRTVLFLPASQVRSDWCCLQRNKDVAYHISRNLLAKEAVVANSSCAFSLTSLSLTRVAP